MPIYDDAKALIGIISEVRRLRDSIRDIGAAIEETRKRLNDIDRRMERFDLDQAHFIEKTRVTTEAAIHVGIARMEGDVKARLVELDLRLQAVERDARKKSPTPRLPKA